MEIHSESEITQPESSWASLPRELRLMILEAMKSLVRCQSNHPMANLVCVSKEWQGFFEPLLWRTLTLRPSLCSDFQGFRQLVESRSRRTALIRTIALQIDLVEGICGRCHEATTNNHSLMINKRTISDNLRTLFSTLAKWTDLNATAGIALELGAKLPRDDDMDFPAQRCGCYWGSRFNHWTSGSSSRVLENRLSLENAPVITSLSIKKSFPSQLLVWPITKIIRSLPCLEQIDCERRLEGDPRDLLQNPSANSYIIRSRYFTTASAIRSISLWVSPNQYLFQDRYDFFKIKAADRYTQLNIDATRASFDLEEMAISHALDARDFFHYFSSKVLLASASVSLERLALTCKVGKLSTEPAELEQLLIAASKAATYMPRLRIMETWSPGLGKGFFFRYEVEKSQAKLTVAATWPIETLSAQVVESWQEIASRQGDRRFLWSTDSINSDTLTREDSICKHLRLFPLLRNWENN